MKPLWTMTSPWVRALVIPIVLTTAPPAAAIEGPEDEPLALISLEFSGGSAMDYVATIRRAAGETNIVVAPEASEIPMPPVTLTQVTVAGAIDLLHGRGLQQPSRAVTLLVKHMPMYDPAERQTYQVMARVDGRAAASPTQVWTVSNLLTNGITSEAVLGAVEMALEVVSSSTEMDIRFHEDTGLLIARGNEEQLEVINEVLDRLNDSLDQSRKEQLEQWEAAVSKAQHGRNEAWGRLEHAEAQMQQAQEEAAMFQQEAARQEVQVAQLQRMLEANEQELAAVSAALRQTQAQVAQVQRMLEANEQELAAVTATLRETQAVVLELERQERAQRELQRERPND